MGRRYSELKAYLQLSEGGRPSHSIPRTYRALAKEALPRLLAQTYGPAAESAARRIQAWWRSHGRRRVMELRGPLAYDRGRSDNEEDPCTLVPVREIPIHRFWSYVCPETNRSYGWDVLAAHRWFCTEGQPSPFDRRPLSPSLCEHLARCYAKTLEIPRISGALRREHAHRPKLSVSDEVFVALERAYGLIFHVDGLRTAFHDMNLRMLGTFYRDLRDWILQFGPKDPAVIAWFREDARPRHRNLVSARHFVALGFWRLWKGAAPEERGQLLIAFAHILQSTLLAFPAMDGVPPP